MKAVEKCKRLYRQTTVREKLLLFAFVVVAFAIWANALAGRFGEWNSERKTTATQLKTQRQWLDRADEYARGLERALERVDPAKTYSSSQLAGKIDALVRQAGLLPNADIAPVRTREGEIFNDHDVRVRLNRISIAQLIEFNRLLKQNTPYINLQSLRISKNSRRPEELDVRFEINSFELKDPDPSTTSQPSRRENARAVSPP